MTTIQEDNRRVGAEHEIAHALAYIAHGRPFIDVEVDDIGCGAVNVEPWSGRSDVIACIKMAGPAADFAYLARRDGEDTALEATVDGWRELLNLRHPDDDPDAMRSDQAGAAGSGLMAYGFAWAAGFFTSNRDLISELGAELRAAGGQLNYSQVLQRAVRRLQGADPVELTRMLNKVSAYSTAIEDVQANIRNLAEVSN
ncbi:hypothetical protein [Leifsonia poae]|uniref:hypothetical protein n=1 Tax=Leifsonia poae TaxID=110933 RepID=UPI001CC1B7C7|nr:hypothetical protein [Leifsonia poae]